MGVPKEHYRLEKRVAATPESVQRLIKPGFKVQIESGAGLMSEFTDADYEAAGATIVDSIWKSSDIVLKVRCSDLKKRRDRETVPEEPKESEYIARHCSEQNRRND